VSESEDFWTSIRGLFAIIAICAGTTVSLLFLAFLVFDDSDKPCSEMTNRTVKNLPVRCYGELGVTSTPQGSKG